MTAPCAIFDLDGTLVDTAPDLVGAANDLLSGFGFDPLPVSIAQTTAGFGGKALLRAAHDHTGATYTEDTIDALYHPFLDAYAARIANESVPYEGVIDTLDTLTSQGWIIGVCTNKPEGLALDLLERLDLLHRFGAMIGADTLPVRKPDPAPLFEAIARCGGTPGNSVMIGDTDTDRNTAKAANIPCILTTFGYSAVDVSTLDAEAMIDHFPQLLDTMPKLLNPALDLPTPAV